MSYSLILTSDTLDIGRQKVNAFMQSSAGVWSSDTPNYAVVSVQGATNSNSALGNYTFVTGKNNKNYSGAFSILAGGTNNYNRGIYSTIIGGVGNKQTNQNGIGNTIINGKNNYIDEGDGNGFLGPSQYKSYNVMIGTTNSTLKGQRNITIASNATYVYGRSNFIVGSGNDILRNGYAGGNVGPQVNAIFGNDTQIYGAGGFFMNQVRGFDNKISSPSAQFSSTNTLWGSKNYVLGGGNFNFFMGSNTVNQDTGLASKDWITIFGQGSSTANPLRPSTSSASYQFILGSANATQSLQRKFRINFGTTSPALFLNSGTVNLTGADYGEYFEWADGNSTGEDRAGYFVELVNGKIQKASSNDVIGIVSRTASIIGDSNDDVWPGTILTDEWGNSITTKFQEYTINESEKEPEKLKKVYFDSDGFCYSELPNAKNKESVKINISKEDCKFSRELEVVATSDAYDYDRTYVPRKDRNEWDVIGLLGKIRVRTSETINGSLVDVDTITGMAKNGTKYPIIKKNKDFDGKYGIVTIFFK